MGKAAENEKHKIAAAFYNNLAVAVVLAGCLVPYLGLLRRFGQAGAFSTSFVESALSLFTFDSATEFLIGFGVAVFSLLMATLLRKHARSELEKIRD